MDITRDKNRAEAARLLKIVPDNGIVKTAEEVFPPGSEAQLAKIPSSSFADGASGRYPCHTKAACFLSACYLANEDREVPPDVMENLSKFARVWNIEPQVKAAFVRIGAHRAMEKQAKEAINFALDEMYNGHRVRRFPVDTPELVKLSTTQFLKDRDKYPYEWRQKTANTLLDMISRDNMGAWYTDQQLDTLEKTAGRALLDKAALHAEYAVRKSLLKKSAELTMLGQVVDALDNIENPTAEHTKLACRTFARFDAATGLRGMTRLPEDRLPNGEVTLRKVAARRDAFVKLANGSMFDMATLTPEKLAAVSPGLETKTAEELKEILPTLPATSADVLCAL